MQKNATFILPTSPKTEKKNNTIGRHHCQLGHVKRRAGLHLPLPLPICPLVLPPPLLHLQLGRPPLLCRVLLTQSCLPLRHEPAGVPVQWPAQFGR